MVVVVFVVFVVVGVSVVVWICVFDEVVGELLVCVGVVGDWNFFFVDVVFGFEGVDDFLC